MVGFALAVAACGGAAPSFADEGFPPPVPANPEPEPETTADPSTADTHGESAAAEADPGADAGVSAGEAMER